MTPAIVLAGGLGTRLRSVVPDLPKPMADVAGKPFLWWILRRLERQGLTDVYLAIGYKREVIEGYFGETFGALRLHYVVEDAPLGTGGAIAKAMARVDAESAYVLNGDTMAIVELAALTAGAADSGVDLAMAVAELPDVSRYGAVDFDPASHRVTAFREKGMQGHGFINAGVYLLKREPFMRRVPGERFSFEQDYLHACLPELHVAAVPRVSELIDIGVPQDYVLAQTRVPAMAGDDAK
ncbi:nucleotidyl transferase family protein [Burkholderia thailandensis MSMB121]|uniref:Putative nucleotidyl transferase n=1 Tax=Burkholderia humptydooensis TaxID=430531 RepID=G3FNF8_9BURK|nr:nucleotidyltransferase family protein [Burkholderia humptydooensis]AGK48379.1 nucleotidyl transferase family protein [Burkholderia thailandensis MSMB121]ATF36092.1 nucleotidyl transferase [Burkholderia thailandensis]ADZ55343.1 putative nucleotidyl transferase [Burkholderia humptydooensis]AEO78267.1 putative nucleotidyl transferase [Burkholderia humptydooensis]KST73486.1 nucleotidyl transferase [Burkholderia humptydooensis]